MKKIFLIILVFVISLSSYNFAYIDVKAAEDSITDAEIIDLTVEAYELFNIAYHLKLLVRIGKRTLCLSK